MKILVKSLWPVTWIHVQPEDTISVGHVVPDLLTSIVTGQVGMSLSLTQPALNLGVKMLDDAVTSNIKPNN